MAPFTRKDDIPWDTHISQEELAAATISTKSTSPGIDGITVRLLKACWPTIKEPVRRLFQACLEIGHHPLAFRTADVIMLRKNDKKDLTSVRSWRPISLLSCLGKGLERLVARRVAETAVQRRVLSPQQAGALPKRSATDLLACLTHEIEHALETRLTASMITLDVKGAFDATLRRRLVLCILRQGWPVSLARFVSSFMQNRKARVRLEDRATSISRIRCGLPQGSPLSPILFLLSLAEVLLQDTTHRFGYADDLCIYRIGHHLEDNAAKLSQDLQPDTRLGYGKQNLLRPRKE